MPEGADDDAIRDGMMCAQFEGEASVGFRAMETAAKDMNNSDASEITRYSYS